MLLLRNALSADGAKLKRQILVISMLRLNKTEQIFDYLHLSPSVRHLRLHSPLSRNFLVKIPEKNILTRKIKNYAYPASMIPAIRTNEFVSTLELLRRKESLTLLPVARKA